MIAKPYAHLHRSSIFELRAANIDAFLSTAEEGVNGGDLAREFSRWAESALHPKCQAKTNATRKT